MTPPPARRCRSIEKYNGSWADETDKPLTQPLFELYDAEKDVLAIVARDYSVPLRKTVGSSTSLPEVRQLVIRTSGATGDRVTLLSVNRVLGALQVA